MRSSLKEKKKVKLSLLIARSGSSPRQVRGDGRYRQARIWTAPRNDDMRPCSQAECARAGGGGKKGLFRGGCRFDDCLRTGTSSWQSQRTRNNRAVRSRRSSRSAGSDISGPVFVRFIQVRRQARRAGYPRVLPSATFRQDTAVAEGRDASGATVFAFDRSTRARRRFLCGPHPSKYNHEAKNKDEGNKKGQRRGPPQKGPAAAAFVIAHRAWRNPPVSSCWANGGGVPAPPHTPPTTPPPPPPPPRGVSAHKRGFARPPPETTSSSSW